MTSTIEDSWPDDPIFTGADAENQPTDGPSERSSEAADSEKDPPRRELSPGTVEQFVHQYVNEERSQRGLSKVTYDEQLGEIARYHSKDMAENGYFSHDSPGGESMSDRYDRFDYDCRVPAGGNTYLTGAENIAYTYFEERIAGGEYHDSPGDVGRGIVDGWMNSQGHRENILTSEWRTEGIGVAITETSQGTRVYVTQNFC